MYIFNKPINNSLVYLTSLQNHTIKILRKEVPWSHRREIM